MNTKLQLLTVAITLAIGAPAHADTVAEQIRNQGRAAVESVGTEIKLNAIGVQKPERQVTVDEAIRLQGEYAARSVGLELTLRFYGRQGPTVAASL